MKYTNNLFFFLLLLAGLTSCDQVKLPAVDLTPSIQLAIYQEEVLNSTIDERLEKLAAMSDKELIQTLKDEENKEALLQEVEKYRTRKFYDEERLKKLRERLAVVGIVIPPDGCGPDTSGPECGVLSVSTLNRRYLLPPGSRLEIVQGNKVVGTTPVNPLQKLGEVDLTKEASFQKGLAKFGIFNGNELIVSFPVTID